MLSQMHVLRALHAKQEEFATFEGERLATRQRYETYVEALSTESRAGLTGKLQGIPHPGALPTAERVEGQGIVRRFGASWQNHEEARTWAMERLEGVRTVAVDGSQITPDPSLMMPVGAVQVGWFENPHDAAQRYVKDILFEVLAPSELSPDQLERQAFPDQLVNARRFDLECEKVASILRAHAGETPAPVVFFDGSLAISFAAQMRAEMQRRYIGAVLEMLKASEEARVPLVAYVDTSYATDLVAMLRWLHIQNEVRPPRLSDGAILRPLMAWGDRTDAWLCARDDNLFEANPQLAYYDRVHFLYLKVSSSNPPVRLDLPSWILEDGRLDEVMDVVRAECIVGTGYPYAIETADALAVITMQDRERFYGVLQDFVQQNGLSWTFSRKTRSKRGRR
ncbi:MAG: DNA double-strand break repair nuclease NurA [Anaerolineae bacterium]